MPNEYKLAPKLLLSDTEKRAQFQASLICQTIEKRANYGKPLDEVYIDDLKLWERASDEAFTNCEFIVNPHEMTIELPQTRLVVRYFNPEHADEIPRFLEPSQHIETVELHKNLSRQVAYRLPWLVDSLYESLDAIAETFIFRDRVNAAKAKIEELGRDRLAGFIRESWHKTEDDFLSYVESALEVYSRSVEVSGTDIRVVSAEDVGPVIMNQAREEIEVALSFIKETSPKHYHDILEHTLYVEIGNFGYAGLCPRDAPKLIQVEYPVNSHWIKTVFTLIHECIHEQRVSNGLDFFELVELINHKNLSNLPVDIDDEHRIKVPHGTRTFKKSEENTLENYWAEYPAYLAELEFLEKIIISGPVEEFEDKTILVDEIVAAWDTLTKIHEAILYFLYHGLFKPEGQSKILEQLNRLERIFANEEIRETVFIASGPRINPLAINHAKSISKLIEETLASQTPSTATGTGHHLLDQIWMHKQAIENSREGVRCEHYGGSILIHIPDTDIAVEYQDPNFKGHNLPDYFDTLVWELTFNLKNGLKRRFVRTSPLLTYSPGESQDQFAGDGRELGGGLNDIEFREFIVEHSAEDIVEYLLWTGFYDMADTVREFLAEIPTEENLAKLDEFNHLAQVLPHDRDITVTTASLGTATVDAPTTIHPSPEEAGHSPLEWIADKDYDLKEIFRRLQEMQGQEHEPTVIDEICRKLSRLADNSPEIIFISLEKRVVELVYEGILPSLRAGILEIPDVLRGDELSEVSSFIDHVVHRLRSPPVLPGTNMKLIRNPSDTIGLSTLVRNLTRALNNIRNNDPESYTLLRQWVRGVEITAGDEISLPGAQAVPNSYVRLHPGLLEDSNIWHEMHGRDQQELTFQASLVHEAAHISLYNTYRVSDLINIRDYHFPQSVVVEAGNIAGFKSPEVYSGSIFTDIRSCIGELNALLAGHTYLCKLAEDPQIREVLNRPDIIFKNAPLKMEETLLLWIFEILDRTPEHALTPEGWEFVRAKREEFDALREGYTDTTEPEETPEEKPDTPEPEPDTSEPKETSGEEPDTPEPEKETGPTKSGPGIGMIAGIIAGIGVLIGTIYYIFDRISTQISQPPPGVESREGEVVVERKDGAVTSYLPGRLTSDSPRLAKTWLKEWTEHLAVTRDATSLSGTAKKLFILSGSIGDKGEFFYTSFLTRMDDDGVLHSPKEVKETVQGVRIGTQKVETDLIGIKKGETLRLLDKMNGVIENATWSAKGLFERDGSRLRALRDSQSGEVVHVS